MKEEKAIAGMVLIFISLYIVSPVSNIQVLEPKAVNYNIDTNWNETGTLDNLETNSDIIYAEGNQAGNWTGQVIESEQSEVVDLQVCGDPRDGNASFVLNSFTSTYDSTIDEVFKVDLVSECNTLEVVNVSDYDVFEPVVNIEETAGSSNDRPNVDSIEANFRQTFSLNIIFTLLLSLFMFLIGVLLFVASIE